MRRWFPVFMLVMAVSLASAPAFAQTKLTATMACGKPDPQHMVAVGDRRRRFLEQA